MKKSFRAFPVGSAQYVVAHAVWQRSRGRGPSCCFGEEREPRQALRSAFSSIKTSIMRADGNRPQTTHLLDLLKAR